MSFGRGWSFIRLSWQEFVDDNSFTPTIRHVVNDIREARLLRNWQDSQLKGDTG